MNRDILTQTLNNALLYDTETLTYYNDRDDNILFATYYRCPKGRVYRKTNKYRYLSKPNFENWVKYFKPMFKETRIHLPVSAKKTPPQNLNNNNQNNIINQNNINNVNPTALITPSLSIQTPEIKIERKLERQSTITFGYPNFDPTESILYDADDVCLGEVTERIKYMFPTDDGVFIRKIIENGIFSSHSNYVIKDNLIFGIRRNTKNKVEFWLRFDNDVLLTVNYNSEYNPYITAQEESKYDTQNGTFTNLVYKNGLNVQIIPNGEVCQKIINHNDEKLIDDELHRIITSKASVIKYHSMDKINVMYANGNVCQIVNGLAINTNNKGLRLAKRLNDKTEYEMDSIPITIQTDPETNSKNI
jgi:hypothetical protein